MCEHEANASHDGRHTAECEHGLDRRLPCGDCQKDYEANCALSPSTSLLCETCGRNVIPVDGVTAVWSRGYWWCTRCLDIDSYRDGQVIVAFPSHGKLIPPTVLTHND